MLDFCWKYVGPHTVVKHHTCSVAAGAPGRQLMTESVLTKRRLFFTVPLCHTLKLIGL